MHRCYFAIASGYEKISTAAAKMAKQRPIAICIIQAIVPIVKSDAPHLCANVECKV